MAVNITINVADEDRVRGEDHSRFRELEQKLEEQKREFDRFSQRIGSDAKPFPRAKLGGYMSHFKIVLELETDEGSELLSIVSPLAAQTVSWSDPFIYQGPDSGHVARVQIPSSSQLPSVIREEDFLDRPEEFFQTGKETIWLQILNLDARMETTLGPVRIILGETLLREHPDLFQPSLGVAQSIGDEGFPARLYFNPYAIIETRIGSFRAIHGTLSYGRVTNFPPIGTPISIADCIPIEPIEEVYRVMRERNVPVRQVGPGEIEPVGRIIALTHPIDMEIQLKGEEIYDFVERCIVEGAEEAEGSDGE